MIYYVEYFVRKVKTIDVDQKKSLNRAFGVVLRKHREASGIAQERFALQIGVNRTYVSMVERGLSNPTIGSLFRFAEGLGVTPERLIAETRDLLDSEGDTAAEME
jgi:transcriptional regulator with XRE-family HTH domain